jgi:hypothetical protein
MSRLLSANLILRLQTTAGNRAVLRLLERRRLMRALEQSILEAPVAVEPPKSWGRRLLDRFRWRKA